MLKVITKKHYQSILENLQEINDLRSKIDRAIHILRLVEIGEYDQVKLTGEDLGFPLFKSISDINSRIRKLRQSEDSVMWASAAFSKFTDVLRLYTGKSDFYDKVLENLVKLVSANQGSLFLVQEAENGQTDLVLISCYAYSRKKHIQKAISAGQGLLGQCYCENQMLFLTDIPSDYIKITSGLGEATPRCLLIIPFSLGTKVFAIAEFASFQIFSPQEIGFLQKVGETVASAIANEKNSAHMKYLINSLQKQEILLKAKADELERLKLEEDERMQEVQNNQRKTLEAYMKKYSERERNLLERISLLEEATSNRGIL